MLLGVGGAWWFLTSGGLSDLTLAFWHLPFARLTIRNTVALASDIRLGLLCVAGADVHAHTNKHAGWH